ncbi:MAG: nucleotidyltransferase domain-containing protein [Cyanobacteria bacterium P01_H01_bin.121]
MQNDILYQRLGVTPEQISEFCQRSRITELSLFGSILRQDFRSNSDVDMLVTFASESKISLLGLVGLETELKELLHRDVDLVSKKAVEHDRNWLRRREILSNYQVIYESRSVLSA